MRLLLLPIAALLIAAAPDPTPEAIALGRELAGQGTLASLLPLVAGKELEEMVAAQPDLTDAERETLREIARQTADAGIARMLDTLGQSYASQLSLEDLKALTTFNRTDAARRHRESQPAVIAATVQAMDGMDFKGDTMKAFCAKTGKGCAAE